MRSIGKGRLDLRKVKGAITDTKKRVLGKGLKSPRLKSMKKCAYRISFKKSQTVLTLGKLMRHSVLASRNTN